MKQVVALFGKENYTG